MDIGMIIGILTFFSFIWGGAMWVLDSRSESRTTVLKSEMRDYITFEVRKYRNVYTLDEILDMINQDRIKDIDDLKIYVEKMTDSNSDSLSKHIKSSLIFHETIYFIDKDNNKYVMYGDKIDNKFLLMRQELLEEFPFEYDKIVNKPAA